MSDEPYRFLPPPAVLEALERKGWKPGDPPLDTPGEEEPEPPPEAVPEWVQDDIPF